MSFLTMTLPTVRDIMGFHKIDRVVYEKLVMHGTHPGVARDAVCLFMWLDQLMIGEVAHSILYLSINNPPAMVSLIAEAEAVLHCIQQDDNTNAFVELPCLSNLLGQCIDMSFFDFRKELIVKALAHKMNGVGRIIFDDYLYEILHAYETNLRVVEQEAARWGRRAMIPALPAELTRQFHLTSEPATPEDDRSIFMNTSAEGNMDYLV